MRDKNHTHRALAGFHLVTSAAFLWLLSIAVLPAMDVLPLSWTDCVRELQETNPELQAARENLEKAKADLKAAYSPFLPQISANAGASRSSAESDDGHLQATSYKTTLSANQSIFSGFRDVAELRRNQAALASAEAAFQAVKAGLSFNLTAAFSRLLYAQDFVLMANQIADRRKDNVGLVEMRFEAGRENKGSYLRSKAYYRQALFDVNQAKRNLKAAQQNLASAMGRPVGTGLTVTGEWSVGEATEAPAYLELARQTPEYLQALAQTKIAREGVRSATSSFWPDWSVSGSVGRFDDEFFPQRDQWSIGTTISLPLFTGGRDYYALRKAQAEQRATEGRLANTVNTTAAMLEERFTTWQNALELLEVQAEFLQAAEIRSEIALRQYQNGLLSFEDWDLIENDLIEKKKAMLAVRRDAVVARANWEKALGIACIP